MDLRAFHRDLAQALMALAVGQGAIFTVFGAWELSATIAVTSVVALWWLRGTASRVAQMVSTTAEAGEKGAQQAPDGASKGWQMLSKLAPLVLALGFFLWYMPARPEGVVLGVLNGLLALIYAGVRHQKRTS